LANKYIHIISFDIPCPADYGGVIDVFFKLKALHLQGVKVHLHCFEYGRAHRAELNKYCESVHYYKRTKNKALLFHGLPYVVVSRRSEEMVERLSQDRHPILFEGLHSCYHLGDNRLFDRKRFVRTHNVEHHYYKALAEAEEGAFKRAYFQREAVKLEKYEPVLSEADQILCISKKDQQYFNHYFGKGELVHAFHSNDQVDVSTGLGKGAFYHGNLAVPENDKAARYLITEVFSKIDVPLTIAGSNPSVQLKKLIGTASNVSLVTEATPEKILELVKTAQVNVLPTFQATGIKLKLLLCLFAGRHVVCNTPMVEETGLSELTNVADDPHAMADQIEALMEEPLATAQIEQRKNILEQQFSNTANAKIIRDLL